MSTILTSQNQKISKLKLLFKNVDGMMTGATMKYFKNYILTLSLFIFNANSAWAGSELFLFVPNQYVPLSSFQQKTSSTSETMSFAVKPSIIQFVVSRNYTGFVAFQNASGKVSLLPPTSYDSVAGTVSLSTQMPGKYVVVADPFTNDYPIVTHWQQSLNSGRGGFQLGASDGIGTLDFLQSGNVVETTDLFDSNPNSIYTFNTNKYALFSSDPTNPTAKVPGYERYVGENYSVDKITDRLAVYLSLKSLETTGFPLIHRNHPWAFYSGSPAEKQVMQNFPAFQIVHALSLAIEVDKPSLYTFILPPNWTSTPSKQYPVIFNGFYDIHQNLVSANGLDFIKVIGDLQKDNVGSAIGVLWNGGGSYGATSVQLSSYLNVAYLFAVIPSLLGADAQNVTTIGLSRGGHTALNVAANPIYNNYKVRYALAFSPGVAMGEYATKWFSSNFPGLYSAESWITGYKYSGQAVFKDPITNLDAAHLFLQNIVGSTDPGFADLISPMGDWSLNSLKTKGTSVYLSSGTNDVFLAFDLELRLYNKMKSLGIPVEMDIGYRFGHSIFTDKNALMYSAVKEMMNATYAPYSGMKHFKRSSETQPGFAKAVQFTPTNPLALTLPKVAYLGQSMQMEAMGSKDLMYAIIYYKIDDTLWNNFGQISVIGNPQTISVGTFSGVDPIQAQAIPYIFPAYLTTGKYLYLAATSSNKGVTWSMLDSSHVPQDVAARLPIFDVQAQDFTQSWFDFTNQYVIGDRGWGLSIY